MTRVHILFFFSICFQFSPISLWLSIQKNKANPLSQLKWPPPPPPRRFLPLSAATLPSAVRLELLLSPFFCTILEASRTTVIFNCIHWRCIDIYHLCVHPRFADICPLSSSTTASAARFPRKFATAFATGSPLCKHSGDFASSISSENVNLLFM